MKWLDTYVLLRNVIDSDKNSIDACLQEDASIVCVHRETRKQKTMSFAILYENNKQFWLRNGTWEYFFEKDELAKIKERITKINAQWQPSVTVTGPAVPDTESDMLTQGFGKEYEAIAAMTEAERVIHIQESRSRLDTLITQKPRQEQQVTEALVETTRDAVLYNHAALMSLASLPADEAKTETQDLVASTHDLVKASTQLITSNIFNNELMNTLVTKSNGTILQHMTRVYLKGLAFLSYYNKLISSSSMIIKLRVEFEKKYKFFYRSLMPHIHPDDLSLEKVFLGGMRAIAESTFYDWAVGFLIHDIGKANAVEYHEGEAAYDRAVVMDHVKTGYTSIKTKTNYPQDAVLITGYHHEYYGDASGYGYFRPALEMARKQNPQFKPNFCITYDINPMLHCEAWAFFPAKVLEIIDVYDSLTDPSRKYKKAMNTEEALVMMKEEFIEKHCKLDIILFEIFSRFVQEIPVS